VGGNGKKLVFVFSDSVNVLAVRRYGVVVQAQRSARLKKCEVYLCVEVLSCPRSILGLGICTPIAIRRR